MAIILAGQRAKARTKIPFIRETFCQARNPFDEMQGLGIDQLCDLGQNPLSSWFSLWGWKAGYLSHGLIWRVP